MLEGVSGVASVVADTPAVREAIGRLAGRLGLEVDRLGDSRSSSVAPVAILFHVAALSEQTLGELRDVVRRATPSPVIVLASGLENDSRRRLREAGAAEVVGLTSDETRMQAVLAGVLARVCTADAGPCPRCPMPEVGNSGSACLMRGLGPAAGVQAADQQDDGHWHCFPFFAVSQVMLSMEQMARKAAWAGATVLITGESGVGKEVLARYVHWSGGRRSGPFVKVNCAALPDNLLESELFGYEKGAFTGAVARKPGRFELARGGVLLLDEIAEMDLGLQAKLLHVLQDRRFVPLGGVREVSADVQVVATTNKDLEREVAAGRFRTDLYYRLRVIELRVPPLREHPEDVPLLARYFAYRFATQYGQCVRDLGPETLERLSSAQWPGNVRELENFMRRLVILGEQPALTLDRERSGLGRPPAGGAISSDTALAATPAPPAIGAPLSLREAAGRAARAAERDAIRAALERTRWNRLQAARLLGVSYKTLLAKMKRLAL